MYKYPAYEELLKGRVWGSRTKIVGALLTGRRIHNEILNDRPEFVRRAPIEIQEHWKSGQTSTINRDSMTHWHPISNIPEIPTESAKEFDELKTKFQLQSATGSGPSLQTALDIYYLFPSTRDLFNGLRYPLDDKPMVHPNPFDYFAPGYKKCICGLCLIKLQTMINDANDNTIKWDERVVNDWQALVTAREPEYKHFCSKFGIDFHPGDCNCHRCCAVSGLVPNFRHICPLELPHFKLKFMNIRKDIESAVKSGIGLTTVMNPIFPFLSHRMLQLVSIEELLDASGTSQDLMIRLSTHKKKYDIDEIMTLFNGKTLKAFCKKNLKGLKLNKGNKYMTVEITDFLNKAQDKAGRKICSDAWGNVLDFLGKSWMELHI